MNDRNDKLVFWGCFLALITTAFGFISRMFLIGEWATEFDLDPAQAGRLAGIGIWPFAISIIAFSLFIDRIGYKMAMVISFLGYMIWSVMGVSAFFISDGGEGNPDLGFKLLYWGSLILGLTNGTIEAYINPVVATMFNKEKTKWLNILHAGWPGGLVIAGLATIALDAFECPWWIKVGIIAPPAVAFFLMLLPLRFPVQERVASGVSYREMLGEFGILGASVVGVLVSLQLMDFFSNGGTTPLSSVQRYVFIGIGVVIVAAFGVYTRSLGRPLLFVLALLMTPLATTEIGTDGWITGIMEGVFSEVHPGWLLIYTSIIMMVLRFFAGSIVHRISPLGLLAASCILAIVGLYWLSSAVGWAIVGAATLYAFGKTFFWPTMLGIASEQTPKGGALTLNALGGIGMLAVGTLGFPYIGTLQAAKEIDAVAASESITSAVPSILENGQLTVLEEKQVYEIINYQTISQEKLTEKLAALPEAQREEVTAEVAKVSAASKQGALANMCIFPMIMLTGYILLSFYFMSKGGYQAQHLDEFFTGGVEGPVE
ncbi:MAG: MFS transporter [Planctomycetales bacterium]|nr:MFS transporter [Planctomycetales bacterium]